MDRGGTTPLFLHVTLCPRIQPITCGTPLILLARLRHPSLGFIFPLSHSVAYQPFAQALGDLTGCVREVASVNVCGCLRDGPIPAKCRHLPLDEGDLPFAEVAAVLQAANYAGEIIVQGHGWPGDPDDFLRRSRALLPAV